MTIFENTGRTLLSQTEEEKWNARHIELSTSHQLAGLFRGWLPDAYFAPKSPRILYVGKATSGQFSEFQAERKSFNGKGPFWDFGRQVAVAVGCREEGIPCIAWSNVSKISRPEIAADPSLIVGYEVEAASTLESEIVATKPHIIIFVTGHFSDSIVCLTAHEDSEWNRSENESNQAEESDIWWKRRPDGVAVLWMRHPMGASRMKMAWAVSKIASLTAARNAYRL